MDSDSHNPVSCSDCGERPTLRETPYDDTDYVVSCDCAINSIDVSDAVNDNSLVHPFSGKWSNIDHDHQAK